MEEDTDSASVSFSFLNFLALRDDNFRVSAGSTIGVLLFFLRRRHSEAMRKF